MDDTQYKDIMDAFEQFQMDVKEADDRRKQKLWERAAAYPCSLQGALQDMTKKQMDEIRLELNLKNISGLKKADMAVALSARLPQALPEQLFLMNEDQYDLLRIIEEHGMVDAEEMSLMKIESFLKRGLAFPALYEGVRVLTMPDELMAVFREHDGNTLQKQVRQNEEIVKLTYGMLHYYGVMETSKALEAVNTYLEENVTLLHFLSLIIKSIKEDDRISYTSRGLAEAELFDPDKVKDEQEARPDVPYYPFSKAQLLKAGKEEEGETTQAALQFQHFLREHYEMEEEEADDMTLELEVMINVEASIEEMLTEFQERCEIPSADFLKIVVDHIVHLSNNTRQWILKGHTPNELKEETRGRNIIPFQSGKRVGRNEPCPCGSGNKYKKCCGK